MRKLFALAMVHTLSLAGAACGYRQFDFSKQDGGGGGDGALATDTGAADRADGADTGGDRPADAPVDRGSLDQDGGDAGGGDVRPAVLSVSPPSKDYSLVVVGGNASADFEITNAGGRPAGVPMATVGGADAGQFAVTATCGGTGLDPGDRCTVSVRFAPVTAGAKAAVLQLAASGAATVTVDLSGTGVTPGALNVTPPTGTFPSLLPGATSQPVTFTVKNTGGSPSGALTTGISGSTEFRIRAGGDTCSGMTLAANGMCTLDVVLAPASSGPKGGTLTVMATPGGTTSASLVGTALHPAALSIVPTPFAFPDTEVGADSATRTFTVSNTGDVAAGVTTGLSSALSGTNAGDFQIVSSTCTGTLEANGQCQVVAGFHPTTAGTRSANLVVSAAPGGSTTAMISGGGQLPASISASPGSMDFGRVELNVQAASRTWTITNDGQTSTGALTFTNSNPTEVIVTNGCTAPLAGGAQCTVSVAMKGGLTGPRSGMLTIAAARGGMVTLPVTANAGFRLTVVPTGSGTVTSMPAGLSCGSTCTVILDAGTTVTLQARTSNGSNAFFSGWSGVACSGPARDCAIFLNSSMTVNATFSTMTNNLVFVTSGTYPTNRGSAAAYDNDCNVAATAAGINDAAGGAYVALTSDGAATVVTRLGSARGWVRMDGRPFSDTASGLFTNNQVMNAIRFDEVGRVVANSSTIMTGVNPSGTVGENCSGYTGDTSTALRCGIADGGPGRYTDIGASCHLNCNGSYRIICMGKARTAALVRTPATGRLVWLDSSVYYSGNPAGLTNPDTVCQSERPAGVTTAVAMLNYTTRSISSLLSPSMNYVRPDGTLVGTGAQLAAGGAIESGIWQNANGTYRTGGGPAGVAFTGGLPGTGATTCSDWTAITGTGATGDFGRTEATWWSLGTAGCGSPPVWFYCVQTAP